MKILDPLFAWALVVLGAAHLLATEIPRLVFLRGPWVNSTAVAIVCIGLMNAVRSQRKSDRFLRYSAVVATLLTAGLCLTVLYRFSGNVLHQPAALAIAVLTVCELFFGITG